MDRFDSISPLDYRYYAGNRELYSEINKYLSEKASIRYLLIAEEKLVEALAENRVCSKEVVQEVSEACRKVTAEDVYKEEERIKHDIRALVNCIRSRVSDKAKPYVHFTATSSDIIGTAEAARLKDAASNLIIPQLLNLEKTLIELARREKNTLQIGRTHGQHAEPITFGFAIAEYVSRLGGRIIAIKEAASNLRGKLSGAVGNYNASSLFFREPEKLEIDYLSKLGLKPATHSTQIVEPEFVTDYIHAAVSAFGVLANLADDMRHLQRSEISEVAEAFEQAQVGSSTMPHKRNPINFENVKSMWKAFMPRMTTLYMDQISEHQRDLTNSASSRFATEIIAGLTLSANRLNRIMSKITVDAGSLTKNLEKNKGMISAEPAYILLAASGHPDAHEYVRKLTLKAHTSGKSIAELLFSDREAEPYIKKMTEQQISILKEPSSYTGIAASKTESICRHWEERLWPQG
ncbi:adenylosuccinate lyase [Candidatus Woesearchaeota archaeon]|nr:adenylosuccinate lyase [Candidatus Woesearchaeota archaeon]